MTGTPVTNRRPGKTAQARHLRRNETEPEARLWQELRNRHLNGYKFTRQVPLGPYIADFVCRSQHLIIELDGSQHANSVRDMHRSRYLASQGYAVLRFWNDDLRSEREAVLNTILAALEGRLRSGTPGFTPTANQMHDPGISSVTAMAQPAG
ncbi:endonuclease domain-containing protein [Pararhizobium mangrovi]|uniref:Endonuclease domain-containing protein n=1 Tax=Pararhizobium mangrovi TaxID=2590452 RepID=A0A506U541_9HYPH|nr:DUF559 domain-containing protein [Pararhizobium mangrovi]TPW28970.1 endonuclease domain-containing protein [Pararhizobium mangrovi]